jgi:hypothetical protein
MILTLSTLEDYQVAWNGPAQGIMITILMTEGQNVNTCLHSGPYSSWATIGQC